MSADRVRDGTAYSPYQSSAGDSLVAGTLSAVQLLFSFPSMLLQAQYARLLNEMAALKHAQKDQEKRTASTRVQSEATLAQVDQLRSELQVLLSSVPTRFQAFIFVGIVHILHRR